MEPGQAGRRWNKKHFCSSPFPSPGRPPRRPLRASSSRARAQSRAAPGPRPAVRRSSCSRGRRRTPEPCRPQGTPRGEKKAADGAGAGGGLPDSTPNGPFFWAEPLREVAIGSVSGHQKPSCSLASSTSAHYPT